MNISLTTNNDDLDLAAASIPLRNSRTASRTDTDCCSVATEECPFLVEKSQPQSLSSNPHTTQVDPDVHVQQHQNDVTNNGTNINVGCMSDDGETPLLTRTGDNLDAALQTFYSSLEVGVETVSDSVSSAVTSLFISPLKAAATSAKEDMTDVYCHCGGDGDGGDDGDNSDNREHGDAEKKEAAAMDLLADTLDDVDGDEAVKGKCSNNDAQDYTLIATANNEREEEDVQIEVRAKTSTNDDSPDGGDDSGCLVSIFTCTGIISDGLEDETSSTDNKHVVSKEDGITAIEDGEIKMAEQTLEQQKKLLLKKATTSACADANDSTKNGHYDDVLSRAAMLNAEVETRKAELELKKIRLESLMVDKEIMDRTHNNHHRSRKCRSRSRSPHRRSNLVTFDKSVLGGDGAFDSVDETSTVVSDDTSDDDGIGEVLNTFVKYTCS